MREPDVSATDVSATDVSMDVPATKCEGKQSPKRLFIERAETYILRLQHKLSGDLVLYTSCRRYLLKSIKRASDMSPLPLVPRGPLGPLVFLFR